MPDAPFIGQVRFGGGGPGCPCGTLAGWRKVRAWKAQHGWPLLGSGDFGAYLTQEFSGIGVGPYAATRTIDPLDGTSDGRPFTYVPAETRPMFPDSAQSFYLMDASATVQPIGVQRVPFGPLERVGQVALSNPYTFADLKSDTAAILGTIEPLTLRQGTVTLAARAEAAAGIGIAFYSIGFSQRVVYAPAERFLGEPECRMALFEPTTPPNFRPINGGIYTHETRSQWDADSQDSARRIYRIRTLYLRGGDGRQGYHSMERGFLSFSGFYSLQDVLTAGPFGELTLIDTGRAYFRHKGPYLDVRSPMILDHLEREHPMAFVRTIRLGDTPSGGIPYGETQWNGAADAAAGC